MEKNTCGTAGDKLLLISMNGSHNKQESSVPSCDP